MGADQPLDASLVRIPGTLRERVLDTTLDWVGAGVLVAGGILTVQLARAPDTRLTEWIGIFLLTSFPLLRVLRFRFRDAFTAALVVAHVLAMCAYYESFRGPTPATALAQAGAMLLAGVFFGARGILAACAITVASLAVAASLLMLRLVEPWPIELWDPYSALVWLRYAAVVCSIGGGLAIELVLMLKRLEQTNVALKLTLERERAERETREATQRALHNAQRFQALNQLAAGLAHDFNNSLMVIMSGVHVLRRQPDLSAESRALLGEIDHRTGLAASTAKQLLALGRTDAGRPQRIEARTLLRRSAGTLQQALGDRVQLSLDDDCAASVRIDAMRLEQALLNLAMNAHDAMPDGGVFSVQVGEREIEDGVPACPTARGHFVTLRCADTGTGMDAALLDRLFEPYFTTKRRNGTGLGMSMVRKTIEEAGGFIEVTSQPNQGTTFALHLPAV